MVSRAPTLVERVMGSIMTPDGQSFHITSQRKDCNTVKSLVTVQVIHAESKE